MVQDARATGTEYKTTGIAYKPAYKKLAKKPYSGCNLLATIGIDREKVGKNENSHNSLKKGILGQKKAS